MNRIEPASPRDRFRLWPGMVFVLLGINVAVVTVTVSLAHSDRSFSIEPNYYQKAVEWNHTAHQRQRNNELGWKIRLTTSPSSAQDPFDLIIEFTDRHGQPIRHALVTSTAFPSVHAANRRSLTWIETKPGTYGTALEDADAGWWVFQFTAHAGDDVFTATIEHLVERLPGGAS